MGNAIPIARSGVDGQGVQHHDPLSRDAKTAVYRVPDGIAGGVRPRDLQERPRVLPSLQKRTPMAERRSFFIAGRERIREQHPLAAQQIETLATAVPRIHCGTGVSPVTHLAVQSSLAIHCSFVICYLSFVIWHSSFVIRRSSID